MRGIGGDDPELPTSQNRNQGGFIIEGAKRPSLYGMGSRGPRKAGMNDGLIAATLAHGSFLSFQA